VDTPQHTSPAVGWLRAVGATFAALALCASIGVLLIVLAARGRREQSSTLAAEVGLLSELEASILQLTGSMRDDTDPAAAEGSMARLREAALRAANHRSGEGAAATCGKAVLHHLDTMSEPLPMKGPRLARNDALLASQAMLLEQARGGLRDARADQVRLRTASHRAWSRLVPLGLFGCFLALLTGALLVFRLRGAGGEHGTRSSSDRTGQLFTNLFHFSNDAILIHDLDGRILECNRNALDLFGYDRAAFRQLRVPELHPPSAHAPCRAAFEEAARSGVVRFETEALRADGGTFPAELSASLFEMDGERFVQCILRDVTRRHAQLAELREVGQRAEAASEAKSVFLTNMSHEIRTPMNGVIGMTRLLLDGGLGRDQRALATTIRDSAVGLLHILDDILDLSRAEAGTLMLNETDFELPSLLRECFSLHEGTAKENGLGATYQIASDVPTWVRGDATRLRQVCGNLLGNAVKFTERGSLLFDVERDSDGSDAVIFRVSDTGRGIPADHLSRVFDSFYQVDPSAARRHGGTGLGLAITNRLVTLMGGAVTVESEPDQGTTFVVRVPLPAASPENLLPSGSGGRQRALDLLVVEDSEINREVASGMLTRMGHTVICVEDGPTALRRIEEHEFDAVLLDVQMPGMDGFEVARRIRARMHGDRRRLPLIAFTAQAASTDRDRCLAADMDDHLSKPVLPDELAAVLARWCPSPASKRRTTDLVEDGGIPPALDEEHFAVITSGDTQLQRQLLAVFARETPLLIEAIAAAVTEGDAEHVYERLHKLRGSSDSLGARGLVAACQRLRKDLAGVELKAQDRSEQDHLTSGLRLRWQEFESSMERMVPCEGA